MLMLIYFIQDIVPYLTCYEFLFFKRKTKLKVENSLVGLKLILLG